MSQVVKYDFTGQVALVTGASSGMGLATAKAFAEAGAAVAMVDVKLEVVQQEADKLTATGFKVLAIGCDVAEEEQVKAMVEQTVAAFGRLDMAFNNAGVMQENAPAADIATAEWDRVQGINLRGVWLCLKYEVLQMLKQGGGSIVNCSSVGGYVATPGIASYIAAKHGVIGLTKTAAVDYATQGIRINAVSPGTIKTPLVDKLTGGDEKKLHEMAQQIPIHRVGQPEEIAKVVLWLCSPDASYVIGHALPVDGGIVAI